MPFRKGKSGNPKGRKRGVPNRDVTDFRAALTKLLNAANLSELFEDVPGERRLEVLGKLAEYVFPKLGRTELTGDGGKVSVSIAINGISKRVEPPADSGKLPRV